MKKSILLISVGFLSLTIFISCKKEGCTNSNAINYDIKANKDDGSCIYENNPDALDERTVYLGKYLVTDSIAQPGPNNEWEVGSPYLIQITTGNTLKDTIFINDLAGYGENRMAILSGDIFNITTNTNTNIFNGIGTFDGEKISYKLKVNGPGGNPNLYGKGTKQ